MTAKWPLPAANRELANRFSANFFARTWSQMAWNSTPKVRYGAFHLFTRNAGHGGEIILPNLLNR
jgi:hypothetical protein